MWIQQQNSGNFLLNLHPTKTCLLDHLERAEIIKREITGTTIIPRKALLGTSVLLCETEQYHKKKEVGAKNLEFVGITKGLKPKDMVISETPTFFMMGKMSVRLF